MKKYICGYVLKDFDSFTMANADEVKDSIAMIVLNSSANDKLTEYYLGLKVLIKNNNKIILVLDKTDKSSIRRTLSMLLASYSIYNIYEYNIHDLTDSDIDTIVNREASEIEVEKYIGEDLVAYDKVSDIMLNIQSMVRQGETSKLSDYITSNKELIITIPIIMDFLKQTYNNHITGSDRKVTKMQTELDSVIAEMNSAKDKAREVFSKHKLLEEALEKVKKENSELKYDINSLAKTNKELEERITNMSTDDFESGNSVTGYNPIDVSAIKTFNKYVIYFKEICNVNYSYSMLVALRGYLDMLSKNTKLVIYDRPNDFMAVHKAHTIVNGEKYVKNPDIINTKKNSILVTDTNMAVLKGILSMPDVEVLIIFDRLKCQTDLLTGSLVQKFYLLGTSTKMRDIEESNGKKYPKERTFLETEGAGTLTIPEIRDFSRQTDLSRVSAYASLCTHIGGREISIFDHILSSCGIAL